MGYDNKNVAERAVVTRMATDEDEDEVCKRCRPGKPCDAHLDKGVF